MRLSSIARTAANVVRTMLDFNRGGSSAAFAAVTAALVVHQASAVAAAEPVKLMMLGDSLTAGYGLPPEDGLTEQLERALAERGWAVEVLNAGVSGDTTAGGLARLDWALADEPDAVIVELGANDALRGSDPTASRDNLAKILERLTAQGIPTLLAGLYAPRNWDDTYVAAFDGMWPELAETYGVALYPFFLEGVAGVPELNQADGIHPNREGVAELVRRILPYVEALLAETGAKPASG